MKKHLTVFLLLCLLAAFCLQPAGANVPGNLVNMPAAGANLPVGSKIGEFTFSEDGVAGFEFIDYEGSVTLHYKDGGASGSKHVRYTAAVEPDTEYVFRAKVKVTAANSPWFDIRLVVYDLEHSWKGLGPTGAGSSDDWNIDSLLPSGGYQGGNGYVFGTRLVDGSGNLTELLFDTTWKDIEFIITTAEDTNQLCLGFIGGGATGFWNNDAGEFYMKDISLAPLNQPADSGSNPGTGDPPVFLFAFGVLATGAVLAATLRKRPNA